MVQKVVINTKTGGFNLSSKAINLYCKRAGIKLFSYGRTSPHNSKNTTYEKISGESYFPFFITLRKDLGEYCTEQEMEEAFKKSWWNEGEDVSRTDPILIEIVEELGTEEASDRHASLKVVEIPDGVEWHIEERSGKEWVAENHRVWK